MSGSTRRPRLIAREQQPLLRRLGCTVGVAFAAQRWRRPWRGFCSSGRLLCRELTIGCCASSRRRQITLWNQRPPSTAAIEPSRRAAGYCQLQRRTRDRPRTLRPTMRVCRCSDLLSDPDRLGWRVHRASRLGTDSGQWCCRPGAACTGPVKVTPWADAGVTSRPVTRSGPAAMSAATSPGRCPRITWRGSPGQAGGHRRRPAGSTGTSSSSPAPADSPGWPPSGHERAALPPPPRPSPWSCPRRQDPAAAQIRDLGVRLPREIRQPGDLDSAFHRRRWPALAG